MVRFSSIVIFLFDTPLSSAALQGIVAQAKIYADAINFSILAAKCSYTLAQEAINFADKRSNPKPWGSQSDQLLYLQGMVAVAREGKANTDKVCHKFMGVGSTVMRVSWSPSSYLRNFYE